MIETSDARFDEDVLRSPAPVLVEFYADRSPDRHTVPVSKA